MAGVKGKSGVYKRTEDNLKSLSRVKSREKNPNWMGGISLDKEKYFRDYWKKYKENNKHKIKANNNKQRAKRSSADGNFTGKEWEGLLKKFNYRCVFCGIHNSVSKLTVDHIIPLSRGGTNYIKNIQPLCFKCNRKKSNKL